MAEQGIVAIDPAGTARHARTEARGRYPGAFDYKYQLYEDPKNPTFKLHYWALLLWDRIIAIVAFHDPDCDCEKCKPTRAAAGEGPAPGTAS